MKPTLRGGDGLEFVPVSGTAELRRGDIIKYPHPDMPVDVVHRIVRIESSFVVTRGDSNSETDPWQIAVSAIQGKLVRVHRGNRSFRPASGRFGLCVHRFLLGQRILVRAILPYLSRISNDLADSRVFHVFGHTIRTNVVRIQRDGTEELLLMRGQTVIGHLSPGTGGEWQIRFPYKLILSKDKRIPEERSGRTS